MAWLWLEMMCRDELSLELGLIISNTNVSLSSASTWTLFHHPLCLNLLQPEKVKNNTISKIEDNPFCSNPYENRGPVPMAGPASGTQKPANNAGINITALLLATYI